MTLRVSRTFRAFLSDDAGAVTIDWVTLTAGILLAGLVAVFAIYGSGVGSLVAETNNLMLVYADVDPGEAQNVNR